MRVLAILWFSAAQVWGCSCGVSITGSPPCQTAWQYDAVFTGMVTEITEPVVPTVQPGTPAGAVSLFPQRKIHIRISEALSGLDPTQQEIVVETGMGGGDCGYGFRRGADYIVYASKKSGGAFSTGICMPTKPVENAAEELKYFHDLAHAPPGSEIRVTVYDLHGNWGLPGGGPRHIPGLAGVRVTIDGPQVHKSSVTDSVGRHVFSGLPPGEYRVSSALEGYVQVESMGHFGPVRLHSKGCFELAVPLQLDRKVTGRLWTKDGLPAAGVTVSAVPVRPRHPNDLPLDADASVTDARGDYELSRLPAGDYYVGVSLSRPPTLHDPYARWFYPGTEDPTAAGILHISDKAEVLRFDLTLPAAQHERVVQGAVFWPDGRAAVGVNILLEDPRWAWRTFDVSATTDKQGHFAVHASMARATASTRILLPMVPYRPRQSALIRERVPWI